MKKYLILGLLVLTSSASQAGLKSAVLSGVATCTFKSNTECMERGSVTVMADAKYLCAPKNKVVTVAGVLLYSEGGFYEGSLGATTFGPKGTTFVSKAKGYTIKFEMDKAASKATWGFGTEEGGCELTCQPLEVISDCASVIVNEKY